MLLLLLVLLRLLLVELLLVLLLLPRPRDGHSLMQVTRGPLLLLL